MTTTMTDAAAKIHAFERVGLGLAPFRLVDVQIRKYQACPGAPIQPGGCCAYCMTGIMECCVIESADGKRFIVGNVCVGKTGDKGLVNPTKIALARLRRENSHARDDARIAEAAEALKDDAVRANLDAKPHPRAFGGLTLLSWVLWMLDHAGRAGKVKAARAVEAALREVAG